MTNPYNNTDLDHICMSSLSHFFNSAAGIFAKFTHVETYRVDWANLDNDDFVNKAELYGIKSVISNLSEVDEHGKTPGSLTHIFNDDALYCVGLQYRMDHTEYDHDTRLKEVLAFAHSWIKENGNGQYASPRFIDMPAVKMSALWLSGPKNIFIPVAQFTTKVGDPISVDEQYLDRVRHAAAALKLAYELARANSKDENLFGGGLLPPGS